MNKIYNIIWSASLQKYVVTSEFVNGSGRPSCVRKQTLMALLLGLLTASTASFAGEQIDWHGEGQSGEWSLKQDPTVSLEKALFPDDSLTDNSINIYSDVAGNVYGGVNTNGTTNVMNNEVNVYAGNMAKVEGGNTQNGNTSNNNITLNGGQATAVIGGEVKNKGDTTNNVVTLNGGSVLGYVYGGETNYGDASGNTVIVSAGSVGGNIDGGLSHHGNAENNTVIIKADANISDTNYIYGGSAGSGYTSKNNTLYIQGYDGTVGGISWVQNLMFDADVNPDEKDTKVTIGPTSGMSFKSVENITIDNIDYNNYTDHQINDILIHGDRAFSNYDANRINVTVNDSGVDYLGAEVVAETKDGSSDLVLKYGLSWYLTTTAATGTFTLANVDDSFTVQETLTDVAATNSWDGKTLTKAGDGTLTLATANTYSGGTNILSGTLVADNVQSLGSGDISNSGVLDLNGGDYVLDQNLTTHTGGVTKVESDSTLYTNTLTQESGSELDVTLNLPSTTPQITAQQVNLAGTLNVVGITDTPEATSMTLIDADSAINGDFDTLTIAGMEADKVDFLTVNGRINASDNTQYDLGFGLSWYADDRASVTPATGNFTVTDVNQSFTVGTVLQDVTPDPANAWNGKSLTKLGAGTLILDAANTYSGTTHVDEGTLWLTDRAVIGIDGSQQQTEIANAATLGGTGKVNGNVINQGTLSFGDSVLADTTLTIYGNLNNAGSIISSGNTPGNTLNVNGNYIGDSGSLTLNTQLDGDTSPTDKLNVTGDVSGHTTLYVNNVGGQGAQTDEGIEVVDVGGTSTSDAFSQGNRLNIGAYEYRLYQDNENSNWYLRSEGNGSDDDGDDGDNTPDAKQYRADIGAYLGNQWMARSLQMQTLYDREGSQYRSADGSVWARFRAGHAESNAADGNIETDNNYSQFQLGSDVMGWNNGEQSLTVGVMGSYINANTDSTGNQGEDGSRFSAKGNVEGYNVGLYATWFANATTHQGWYLDSWYQYGTFDNTVDNGELGSSDYDSTANAISLESGYRHDIALSNGNTLSLTPQAQLTWQNYRADSITDESGTRIDGQNSDTWTSRLGLRVEGQLHKKESTIQPYMEFNWLHSSDATAVSFDNSEITQDLPEDRAEIKAGIQANLSDRWSVRAEASGQKGSEHYSDLNGSLSVHYRW